MKEFIMRRVISFALALPALALNYAVVWVLLNLIHLQILWIFSAVFVGDMVGFMFNSILLDWQLRIFKRLKIFQKVMNSETA